jgi:hypothetical protein
MDSQVPVKSFSKTFAITLSIGILFMLGFAMLIWIIAHTEDNPLGDSLLKGQLAPRALTHTELSDESEFGVFNGTTSPANPGVTANLSIHPPEIMPEYTYIDGRVFAPAFGNALNTLRSQIKNGGLMYERLPLFYANLYYENQLAFSTLGTLQNASSSQIFLLTVVNGILERVQPVSLGGNEKYAPQLIHFSMLPGTHWYEVFGNGSYLISIYLNGQELDATTSKDMIMYGPREPVFSNDYFHVAWAEGDTAADNRYHVVKKDAEIVGRFKNTVNGLPVISQLTFSPNGAQLAYAV